MIEFIQGMGDSFIEWFGPVGGLATMLLVAAIWGLHKLVLRIFDMQNEMIALEKACEKEKADLRVAHAMELLAYKKQCDEFLAIARIQFLERDDQKRNDIIASYNKIDVFIATVRAALEKVGDVLHGVQIQLAKSG